jgi:hypothetical protein
MPFLLPAVILTEFFKVIELFLQSKNCSINFVLGDARWKLDRRREDLIRVEYRSGFGMYATTTTTLHLCEAIRSFRTIRAKEIERHG